MDTCLYDVVMVDRFGRKIDYVRISVTDKCNLRCRYCMPEEGIELSPHEELLTYEEILRLVKLLSGMGFKRVRITGGEPLVRRGIVSLIDSISSVKGIEDVSMTTNGVLFHMFAQDLKAAGLRRINISLDTMKRERFSWITRRDRLSDVLRSIETALELGYNPVKVNVVLIKSFNDDELLDFGILAKENPLTVRFIEYMPTGGQSFWGKDKVFPNTEAKRLLDDAFGLEPADDFGGGPAVTYRIKGGKGKVGFISAISSHFCSTCNRIRVTPDGKVRPCLFSDLEFDIKGPMREGAGDEEIASVIKKAIASKPRSHKIFSFSFKKCQRSMRQIGG